MVGGGLGLFVALYLIYLSIFYHSFEFRNRLDLDWRRFKEFLWGGGSLERKPHLVNWATVCTMKKKGGLGLRRFSNLNKALLCKWCWWFANERNSLWRKVIGSKFGEDLKGWFSGDIRGGFGVGLWKETKKEWPLLLQNASVSLGDGRRVSFWKDIWCDEEALCLAYPTLFNLVVHKYAKATKVWDHNKEEGGWYPIFLRSFND